MNKINVTCNSTLRMKYFSVEELCASATALREGIDNRPSKCAYHLLHVLVEQLLDPIREAWGKPIIVSSGYRCKELNAMVGGAKHSHHILGCAADITAPLCSQAKLLDADKSTPKGAKVKGGRKAPRCLNTSPLGEDGRGLIAACSR